MLRANAHDLYIRHPHLQPPRYFFLPAQLLRRCRNGSAEERTLIEATDIDGTVSVALVLEDHGNQYAAPAAQLEARRFRPLTVGMESVGLCDGDAKAA
jgi:hypothetical protein